MGQRRSALPDGLGTRFRRRPDLWIASLSLIIAAVLIGTGTVLFESPLRTMYDYLADSFVAGFITVVVAIFIEQLLRAAPLRPRRALRFVYLGSIACATVGLLATYSRGSAAILQALVLTVLALGGLLVVLLIATGFVRWRDLGRAAGDLANHWGPVYLYILGSGYLLTAIYKDNPAVIDPILLRMDLSLGFNAAEIIGPWVAETTWVRMVTLYGYPLLGFFVAAVAGCLYLAGATAALRRCLLAVLLVSLLGNICYWCAPAISPIYAYPELVSGPGKLPGGQTKLDALRAAIVAGPDRAVLRTDLPRNAMPSLHTAFSLTVLIAAWGFRRRLFWWWLPLGFVQIATTLTHSVHYVVDLIAAVPLVMLCWALAEAGVRRFPPAGAAPLPPLAATGRTLKHRAFALGLSLVAALVALILWGRSAPISPWLAWPLSLVIIGLPVWTCACLFTPSANAAPATSEVFHSQPSIVHPPAVAMRILGFAIFCSGGIALILGQLLEKHLSTMLGASLPAATIVLAVFFAGLALGAWFCPHRVAGADRRLALLTFFVAGWALLVATAFFACDRALGAWVASANASGLAATSLAIVFLWILPPALAMGAQLPTLAAFLAGLPGSARASADALPRLYAHYLAGALVFTVLAPPLLFNLLGANGALCAVATIGLFVGVALWTGLEASCDDVAQAAVASESQHRGWLLAFAGGFIFFALEVIWFHLISAVYGASTYSFSILLALALLGLALGGRSVARATTTELAATLGWLTVALALSNAAWPWVGRILVASRETLALESFWGGELLKLVLLAPLVVPTAVGLGKIFPLLLRESDGKVQRVAEITVVNLLGCIAGGLVTGFALIPAFGAERTLLGLTLAIAFGGLGLAWRRSIRRVLVPLGVGLALLFFLPGWDRLELTRGCGLPLAPPLAQDARLVSFAEDFRAGFVTVVATPSADPARTTPTMTLLQNGQVVADDAGEVPMQVALGLIAAMHVPAQNRALVLGAGAGQSASILARLDFAQVDIAEPSLAHLAAARTEFAPLNQSVFDREGATVFIEDGRNHLRRTRVRYDTILMAPTPVGAAGATNLYSREFYALVRERLTPGGVLVQEVPLDHITPREIATILATARSEFPAVALWRTGREACLIGFTAAPRLNPEVWARWGSSRELDDVRRLMAIETSEAFLGWQWLAIDRVDAMLKHFAAQVGTNTDRNRWLEFQMPKYQQSRPDRRATNLRWIEAGTGTAIR